MAHILTPIAILFALYIVAWFRYQRVREITRNLIRKNASKQLFWGFVVGGLVVSAVNPILIPYATDFEKDVHLFHTPKPEIDIKYKDEIKNKRIRNSTDAALNESQYKIYYIFLRNRENKEMSDVDLSLLWRGCPVSKGVALSNLDSAVANTRTDEIEIRRAPGGCGIDISIEELPPGRTAMIYTTVNTSKTNPQIGNIEELNENQVAVFLAYDWTKNGRNYFESDRYPITVNEKLEKGDRLI